MAGHIKAIKEALPNEDYDLIEKILVENKIENPELIQIMNELKCMKLIREGNSEEALSLIENKITNEEKQSKLAEELMIGTGEIKKDELKR